MHVIHFEKHVKGHLWSTSCSRGLSNCDRERVSLCVTSHKLKLRFLFGNYDFDIEHLILIVVDGAYFDGLKEQIRNLTKFS